jgi:hypothetical protein
MLLRDDDTPRKLTCVVCGTGLQHKRVGRVRRFCSDACRVAAHRTIKQIGFDPFRYSNSVPPTSDTGCNEKAQKTPTKSTPSRELSNKSGSPLNLLGGGNFRFADEIELDPELRRRIVRIELGITIEPSNQESNET